MQVTFAPIDAGMRWNTLDILSDSGERTSIFVSGTGRSIETKVSRCSCDG